LLCISPVRQTGLFAARHKRQDGGEFTTHLNPEVAIVWHQDDRLDQ